MCVSTKLPPVSNLGVTNSEWSVKAAMLATQTRQVKLSCKKSTRSTFLQAQLVLLKFWTDKTVLANEDSVDKFVVCGQPKAIIEIS